MERPPKLQMGEIKFVRLRSAPSWTFTLRVRDQDVEQDLDMQWRIVTGGEPRDRELTRVLPATGEQVREFSISVAQGDLDPDSCHRIEIAVSSSFDQPFEDEMEDLTEFADVDPENRFDVALFTFWLWEGEPNANDPTKLVGTCGAQPVQMTATTVQDGGR